MARTPSSMVALGSAAPDFVLPDVVTGKMVTRADVTGPKGMLAMFICRHCPSVKHVKEELASLGRDYAESGVGIVAISANDESTHPEDSPANLAAMSKERGFSFPFRILLINLRTGREPATRSAPLTSFSTTPKARWSIAVSSTTAGRETACR